MTQNDTIMSKEPETRMHSVRLPVPLIERLSKAGDHMRGGTSEATRRAIAIGLKKVESGLSSSKAA
jgi:hypothetical protein